MNFIGGAIECPELNEGFHNYKGECWHNSITIILYYYYDHNLFREYYLQFPNNYMLPLNFDNNVEYDIYCRDYFTEFIERIKNNKSYKITNDLPEYLPLIRDTSKVCSIKSIENIFKIINTSITEEDPFSDEDHGGFDIHTLQTINLFNYYFFNNNNFLNLYIIHEYNLNDISKLLDKNIIGIQICFPTHATCLFKCLNNYYYYDDNGDIVFKNNQVFVKYEWSDIINKINKTQNLNLLCNELKQFYSNKKYFDKRQKIQSLTIIYLDDAKDEKSWLDKTNHNLIYYSIYDNKRLLTYYKDNINLNLRTNEGKNMLMVAIKYNNTKIIKLLINFKNDYGNTPLMIACNNNSYLYVKVLLENNAKIDVYNNQCKNALMIAHEKNNMDIFNLIINYENYESNTPLMIACNDNNIDFVKYLVDNKAKTDIYNNKGKSAIIIALKKNNMEIIKILINCIDNEGNTELIRACKHRNIEIVKLILEHNPDINIKNKNKDTALIIATRNKNVIIIKLLNNYNKKIKYIKYKNKYLNLKY